jgi:VanZ family protein
MNDRLILMGIRVALVAMVVVTTYFAVSSGGPIVNHQINDKWAHTLAFCILALLADWSAPRSGYDLYKIMPLMCYGLLIEFMQLYLPYRTASMMDLVADATGLLLYGIIILLLRRTPVISWRRAFARE